MNPNNTVEKMQSMRMKTMADLYRRSLTENLYSELSIDDFMAMLIDSEWEDRQRKKIANLIKRANFKMQACLTDIDYHPDRGLDKTLVQRLAELNFIKNAENVILTGATGVGKSYLAQAIGNMACQMLYKTRYFITGRFFDAAKLARLDGTYGKMMGQLEKTDLLILDDFGLHSMDQANRQVLLDIIEQRHGLKSTVIASQIPVSEWHGLIGEGTIADAILDRLVYSSHRIDLKGESLRKKQRLT